MRGRSPASVPAVTLPAGLRAWGPAPHIQAASASSTPTTAPATRAAEVPCLQAGAALLALAVWLVVRVLLVEGVRAAGGWRSASEEAGGDSFAAVVGGAGLAACLGLGGGWEVGGLPAAALGGGTELSGGGAAAAFGGDAAVGAASAQQRRGGVSLASRLGAATAGRHWSVGGTD
jgi:hypothetical protein